MEMMRRMSAGATDLHLSIDTRKGLMFLEREGAQLRVMTVQSAPATMIGSPTDSVWMVSPQGKRIVAEIVDRHYAWSAPDWVYTQRGQRIPSVNVVAGGLGSLAIFLDSGTILYSRPDVGPLNDDHYILPGSIRMATADVNAIAKVVHPGMVVYFY
jgi:hypothetical protein